MVKIKNVRLEETPEGFRASADVTSERGPNGELWFEVTGAEVPSPEMAATAFLAGCLPGAAWIEEDLECLDACDAEFVHRARRLAQAYGRLHKRSRYIKVDAPLTQSPPRDGRIVASSFSGGVDSFYSLLTHLDPDGLQPAGAIVVGLGFDSGHEDRERHEIQLGWASEIANSLNLRQFVVRSNFRAFFTPYANWGVVTHIACLASYGFLLSGSVHTYLVPSAASIDQLFVHGSHALIDGAFISSQTKLVSDGWEAHRDEKTLAIAAWPLAMENLKVCGSQSLRTRNCGKCEKCIRTMINLRLAGVESFPTFPKPLTPALVRQMRLHSPRHFFRYGLLRDQARRTPELGWLAQAITVAMIRGRYRALRFKTGELRKSLTQR